MYSNPNYHTYTDASELIFFWTKIKNINHNVNNCSDWMNETALREDSRF
jgi:hypothetical protein